LNTELPVLSLLPKLAPLAARHLTAYVELAATDATIAAGLLQRRLLAGAISLLGAVFAVLLACTWLLAASWDTPWRDVVFGVLLAMFVAVSTGSWSRATAERPGAIRPFARLRAEWEQDQQLIRDLTAETDGKVTHVSAGNG
jgi:hypothetical protein